MTPKNKALGFAAPLLQSLYTCTAIDTKQPHQIYILSRDAVRTFLHEKTKVWFRLSHLSGSLGIALTSLGSLASADFKQPWRGIPGPCLEAFFNLLFLGALIWAIKAGVTLGVAFHKGDLNIDRLADDLGGRGTIATGPGSVLPAER